MGKRDMYVDYTRYRKRSNRNRRKPPRLFPLLILILLSILLGLGAYKLSKEVDFSLSFLKKGQNPDKNQGKEEDFIKETNLGEEIKDEEVGDGDKINNDQVDTPNTHPDDEKDEAQETGSQDKPNTLPTNREAVKVKGIYITGPIAGSKERMDELIQMVRNTELNTMVIDVKNDDGEITYKMNQDTVREIGAGVNYIHDIEGLIKELKKEDIYLIARIVAFKDPLLANKKPEFSLKNKDGSLFRDKAGLHWVNPYNKGVWDYLVDVSKEAIDIGFDEIQFDYIRFSTDSGMKNVDFGEDAVEKSKTEIITEFTKYAYEQLKPYGAFVSADVYGAIIDSKIDQDIVGQDYLEMAKHLDYICPMIYPSHYADGAYGIDYPDLEPYKLILASLSSSKEVLGQEEDDVHIAAVRPWLQDFTASWISHYKKYGPEEIREQVDGVYDSGYEEWILWNGSNRYTKDGLLKEE